MTATGILWSNRAEWVSPIAFASALTGIAPVLVADLSRADLVLSVETSEFLSATERLERFITASVATVNERCVHSVRGPIQWAETINARVNSFGNDDIYVCSTSTRTYATLENQLLASSLAFIAESVDVVNSTVASHIDEVDLWTLKERSKVAALRLEHPALKKVSTKPLTGREMARVRHGRRSPEMNTLGAFYSRQHDGPTALTLAAACDAPTRRMHSFVVDVLTELRDKVALPESIALRDGVLRAGALTFRHPQRPGSGVPGLAYRGIPLLDVKMPAAEAGWLGELPARGIEIRDMRDLRAFIAQLR